jgi:hypothetical protein
MSSERMYSIRGPNLYWLDRLLGPTTSIYVDATQDTANVEGLVKTHLDVADYTFVTLDQKIVCIEEKKIGDLVNSYSNRRLQRQLRHCAQSGDIFGLAIRDPGNRDIDDILFMEWRNGDPLNIGLLKLQLLGGFLGFLPRDVEDVPMVLRDWRAVLKISRSTLSILAGDDRQGKAKKRQRDLTPCAAALTRLFTGCGPVTATKWAASAHEDIIYALGGMEDADLKAAGVSAKILRQLDTMV